MAGDILMRKILHSFNMVEIVLAIGVVAIGVTGVMALLPPALNANRDVAADAFVAEAASKVSALLNLKYIPDWKNGTNLPFSTSSTQPEPSQATTKGSDVDSNLSDWKVYNTNVSSIYWFESGDGMTVLHASFRQADIPADLYNGTTSVGPTEANNTKRIFVEFSWPVTVALENRQKRLFVFDVSK